MMATELIEIDAAWAEKWTKMRVPFLSAPTVAWLQPAEHKTVIKFLGMRRFVSWLYKISVLQ